MDNDFTPEYSEETETAAYSSGTNGNSATAVKEKMTAVKDKVGQQATELKDKLSEQAKTYGQQVAQKIDDARGKTSAGLRSTSAGLKTTSDKVSDLALYVEENDANAMAEKAVSTSREFIRNRPGTAIVAGIVVGILIGRIFSMGNRS